MSTPGGTVCFEVPVMKVQKYTINEIFAKKLLFLIPFYIFSHENRFDEYNKDTDKLEQLKREYTEIVNRLDILTEEGRISVYTKRTILEMSRKVLENIARKYENVREGVKTVMGGKVLEYEAKTILQRGIQEGLQRGMQEGIQQGLQQGLQAGKLTKAKEIAKNLQTLGMDDETIAKAIDVEIALVREWSSKE